MSSIPDYRVAQIRALWKTRADSFSRAQLRTILREIRIEQIRKEGG